jgi:hypothetical protein
MILWRETRSWLAWWLWHSHGCSAFHVQPVLRHRLKKVWRVRFSFQACGLLLLIEYPANFTLAWTLKFLFRYAYARNVRAASSLNTHCRASEEECVYPRVCLWGNIRQTQVEVSRFHGVVWGFRPMNESICCQKKNEEWMNEPTNMNRLARNARTCIWRSMA